MADLDGKILDALYAVIASRKGGDPAHSYTAQLFADGIPRIARKFGEEAVETLIEGLAGDGARLAAESADLLYHLLVLWAAAGVAPEDVWRLLDARQAQSGLAEKVTRKS